MTINIKMAIMMYPKKAKYSMMMPTFFPYHIDVKLSFYPLLKQIFPISLLFFSRHNEGDYEELK